jgi:hypothetical protein
MSPSSPVVYGMTEVLSPRAVEVTAGNASENDGIANTQSSGIPSINLSEESKRKIAALYSNPRAIVAVTAITNSGSKPPAGNSESYDGFSIVKNRFTSASGKSNNTESSPYAPQLGSRSSNAASMSAWRRTSIGDCNARLTGNTTSTTPHSPQKYHTPMSSHPDSNAERYRSEIASLKEQLCSKEVEAAALSTELQAEKVAHAATQETCRIAVEEANALRFFSSLQEQRIEELDQQVSSNRLERNEALSQKSRKHRAAVKKMNQDRAEYEARADSMIQQMTEQMALLQKMAMSRIEVVFFSTLLFLFFSFCS